MGEAAIDLVHEERLAPRADVQIAIDLGSEHNFWSGLTMNMSEGGVFVATFRDVPVGTTLSVEMGQIRFPCSCVNGDGRSTAS